MAAHELALAAPLLQQRQQKARSRVTHFVERYEEELQAGVLQFAQYAAFPLTLTSELCYLLREKFAPDVPWYVATDLLLSGLCESVGYDLYEMETAAQTYLRLQLADQGDLDGVAQFLSRYIVHRLAQESGSRAKQLGDPAEWIALACLKPTEELTQVIKAQLRDILKSTNDPSERFWLAAMVENLEDLLVQRGYSAVALQELQAHLEKGEPIDEWDALQQAMERAGFPPLKSIIIEVQTIAFTDDTAPPDPDTLTPFTFETVTVDRQGKEIRKETHTAYSYTETLPQGINLEMVAIPSGKFNMGSPSKEHQRLASEGPVHEVTVPPFFLGRYPITQAQWRIVAALPQEKRALKPTPSRFDGDRLPVERVSWLDAEEFCLRLGTATGRPYRLPSEAEWEYACRAGTQTPFYFGETITGKLANYGSGYTYHKERKAQSRGQTSLVGEYPPNVFGLYDMHGNVWEWCLDHWHSGYKGAPTDGSAWLSENDNASRVRRGGSWVSFPWWCRSAYRSNYTPVSRYSNVGVRVVCDSPRTA